MLPSNCPDQVLVQLAELALTLGSRIGYAPQHYAGDPNGERVPRWDYDLCIDTLNHRLYYGAIAGSSHWIMLGAPVLHPDTTAYIDALVTAGYSPSPNYIAAVDELVHTLQPLKDFIIAWFPCLGEVPLYMVPAATPSLHSLSTSELDGLLNTAGGYFDVDILPSDLDLASCYIGWYGKSNDPTVDQSFWGVKTADNNNYFSLVRYQGHYYASIGGIAGIDYVAPAPFSSGMIAVNAIAGDDLRMYWNGAEVGYLDTDRTGATMPSNQTITPLALTNGATAIFQLMGKLQTFVLAVGLSAPQRSLVQDAIIAFNTVVGRTL